MTDVNSFQDPKSADVPEGDELTRLLTEYQAAQASAQHNETIAWTTTSITWAGSLILLGFILQSLGEQDSNPCLISIIAFIGMLMTFGEWLFEKQQQKFKALKYKRCIEIEAIVGFRQHGNVPPSSKVHQTVFALITVTLLVVWPAISYIAWNKAGFEYDCFESHTVSQKNQSHDR